MRHFLLSLSLLLPLSAWADELILVGEYPAKILPHQVRLLAMAKKGMISDLAPAGSLKKGQIIAYIDKEDVLDDKKDMELTILRNRMKHLDTVRDLELEERQLEFYLSLSNKEREYEKEIYSSNNIRPEEAIKDLKQRIDLEKQDAVRTEYTQRRQFKEKEELSTFVMPFDGRIQYHVTLPDDLSKPFECEPIQQFATICDDSAFYITLNISDAALSQLPVQYFSASIELPAGKSLEGSFDFRRVERVSNGDMLVYYFRVAEEDKETAFSLLGTTAKAKLYYKCSANVKRVNKAELSTSRHAEESEDWQDVIKKMYPDYNVLLEAGKDILILPKGEEP